MADYSEDDASRAKLWIDRLYVHEQANYETVGRRSERPPRSELREPRDNLILSDVQKSVRQFILDLDVLGYIQQDMPSLKFADQSIPVSLRYAISSVDRWTPPVIRFPESRHYMSPDYLQYLWEGVQTARRDGEFVWLNLEDARTTFQRLATNFVAARIAGLRSITSSISPLLKLPKLLGGRPTQTPGCNFSVETDSHGLRVFWSGAHQVSPNYFSSPTSPVSSVLQSGTYVFGVDGGAYGNTIQWDQNAVITLPGSHTSVHLNY